MDRAGLVCQELVSQQTSLRVAVVTETYPPEINGVAMTTGRMVDGLVAAGHRVDLIRPRQAHEGGVVLDADGTDGVEEMLSRGIPIPRYANLQLGLPARKVLLRRWSVQRPDVVQVVTEGPLGWSALAAARKLHLPVISEFHTNFHRYSGHYGIGWLKRPIAAYLRKFHNRADLTLVPTRALRDELAGHGIPRVDVVSRGVDTLLFDPARRSAELRRSWGVGPDDLVVLYVGRIAPEKNLALLEQAYVALKARVPAARLVMVGSGPAQAGMRGRLPDVIFAGPQVGEQLAAHFASGDLFLFPSLTETYGNVVAEALASGLPVVAYRDAAALELITPGVHGHLAEPGDERGFVHGAVQLAESPELRARMRLAARERVASLAWRAIVDSLVSLQRQVILSSPLSHRR
ncbi:MAG TPA: glycosyltransferase family 1 protein [Zoogloea sp.]|uniref:glycosyltransferase family 4 protein n=1 Tax=Zoogloea sp. TaxID=49181 RepID=UPI002B6026E2|nr:glycosyltransferase family 1 protein [Zoogloea sp.]HMV18397.1 glycosyltransferase family 1 protein [Rhodocyclaceae bacterium]HMY49688.1 glycosyltransferase family 1 protein [Rhodocyclaceae bacterium]HMZ76108.1 glycosyltransferase family 1 protein [Rhodocyclaceae bacterium]HNB65221.1 glycosyltransferase family 1 protein [Rhodocyclaceae bacterium]HNC80127.1 glycosyltransferase family 1 protein [Rhodocyclaceae bacterium]